MAKFYQYRAGSIRWQGHRKIVQLNGGRSLCLPRSACVTTGETVLVNSDEAFVRCVDGLAKLMPAYVAKETVQVGSVKLELLIKEITVTDELTAYESLANFHYRGQPLFGRTARLIIQSFHPNYPKTIGYIELATPFYMSKPRTAILNRPFQSGGIRWGELGQRYRSPLYQPCSPSCPVCNLSGVQRNRSRPAAHTTRAGIRPN